MPISPSGTVATTKATRPYCDARYAPGDALVFGPESRGLPDGWLRAQPADRLEPQRSAPSNPDRQSLNDPHA